MSTALLIWAAIGLVAAMGLAFLAMSRDRMVIGVLSVAVASLLSVVVLVEVGARVYGLERGPGYIIVGSIEGIGWAWTIIKSLFSG